MALTKVSTNGVKDGSLLNADINASAAIAGSKISPDFGSQNIVTTGGLTVDTTTLKVDSSNNRVGIGTTSPSDKLTISSGNLAFIGGTNDAQYIKFGDSGDDDIGNIFYYHGNNNMVFTTNASEAMRIDSSGNVGIGTTSPSSDLHVKGSGEILRLETTATTGSNYINFNDADENKAFIGLGSGSDDSLSITLVKSSNLRFATSNTERMRIDSSGNLGIGTTSPSSILNVHGSSSPQIKLNSSDASPAIFVGDANRSSDGQHLAEFRANWNGTNVARIIMQAGDDTTNKDNGIMVFSTAAAGTTSEAMRIDESGNVGIGTSSPSQKLHINSGNSNTVALFESSDTEAAIELKDTTGSAVIKARNDFRFDNGNGELMRIDSSGRVSIGTTNHSSNTGIGIKLAMDTTNPSVNTVINQSAGNHSFYHLYNTNATHNGYRFYVKTNGGIANHSGNNENLSDERMKKNITNMGSVYNIFKQFVFRDFNYISDNDSDPKKHGVIAQEVETIDSDLITEDFKISGDNDENYVYRKALKEEQFVMIGLKTLQEAIAKIEVLETKVAALEAA